ncbi:hypothetical protein BHE74_00019823 [Ensete ventricosum]|nr:hypothetical protein BHE74_00019823 [Ensete ventricosum]
MVSIIVCALLVLVLADQLNALSKDCIGVGGGSSDGGSLNFDSYISSCPQAEAIIFSGVQRAIASDPRMAASLLRLHFHDCFVNGCDASVLLDDTPNLVGEKTAGPNLNSLRGFDVVDGIKTELEMACPETVSCADVLAIAARDSVEVGRRDSVTASLSMATANIPAPTSDVATLVQKFQNLGLSTKDMVVLSGTPAPPPHTHRLLLPSSPTAQLLISKLSISRCSHDRKGTVLVVHISAQRGRHRRRRRRPYLPPVAAAALLGFQRDTSPPRLGHAGHLRQPILREPAVGGGTPALGPGAGERGRGGGQPRSGLCDGPGALLRGLRDLHGEDGEAGAAARERGRGPQVLQGGELATELSCAGESK